MQLNQTAAVSASGNGDHLRRELRLRTPAACQAVTARDLPTLVQLGLEAFGEEGPMRYGLRRRSYYERMFAMNRSIFQIALQDGGQPNQFNSIGFIAVVPTTTITYNQFAAGKLSQFEFDERHILPEDATGPRDIFVQALYLRRDFKSQGRRLFVGLVSSIAEHSRYCLDGREDAGRVRIYSEVVSKAGKAVIDSFQMKRDGLSRDEHPVFVMETAPGRPLVVNTSHRLLNAKLQTHATPRLDSVRGTWFKHC